MEGSDVLPSLFHEGNQEVDAHGDVLSEDFFVLVDGSDGGTHTVDLLGLEFDGLLQLLDLGVDLFSFDDVDGESVHLDQHVSEKFGGLFADAVRGKEDVVLLGPLLDFGLVLIESLEAVNIDVGDSIGSGLLDMGSIGKDADLNKRLTTLMLL